MLSKENVARRKMEVFKKIEDAAKRGDVQKVVYAAETLKEIEKQGRKLDSSPKYHIDGGFVL